MSNFRPRQCGLFIVILSSTLSLKTVVFFYPLLFLRSLSPRLKYSRIALCMDALPYAPYFRQRFAPFFRHRRRSQGYLQVPSYSLLQFVIAVTASDGDYYMSNFRPRQCGLFIVILSSTLSLKTVHRTVFLTVAFKSRYQFACKTKKQTNKKVNLFFMVRVTGLEPVRRETHAPQTCLSAYSSTLAFIKL